MNPSRYDERPVSLNRTFIGPVRIIALISGAFLCCIVIILSGMGLYLHKHPERIKTIIEESLSEAAGSSCTIESFSFSLQAGVIEAGGIALKTPGPQQAFSMEIPSVRTDVSLGGPWGRRSLILENVRINGISLNFTSPGGLSGEKKSSFAARMIQGLIGVFLFRDIVFQSGEILDGHISASREDQTVRVNQIQAKAGNGRPLFLSFAVEAENVSRNMRLTAPHVNIFCANALDLNDLKFSGVLQAEDVQLQDAGLEIQRMDVKSKFAYSHARKNFQAENLEVDMNGLAVTGKTDGRLSLMDVNLKVDGISSRYPAIEITNAALKVPQAKIQGGTWDARIHDTLVHIPDGRVDMEKRFLSLPEAGSWQVNAKLSVAELTFQNKAGSLMGENISLTTQAEGVADLNRSSTIFAVSSEAKTGEILYDRFYLNLANNPIVTSCKGTYRFQQKTLLLSELRFDLKDILPLEIKGNLNQGTEPDADFTVSIPQASLKPIFQLLVQEPNKNEMPFLAVLEIGGAVSAEFRIKESENSRQVTGRIGWRKGNIALPDKGISFKGIHLDLPVWYRAGSAQTPVEALKGKLEVQSVTLPPLPEQPLKILLDAGPNRISVDSPTVIPVPGGDFRLGPVHAENIYSSDISVQSRLAFEGLRLRSLLPGIMAFPPQSLLTGMLDPIRYEKNTVTSRGEIATEVFGGRIIVSDPGASGLLTSVPVFKLNAHWDDLRLAEMTTGTAFGQIEGVLKGHINDFEIAYGQPQRFVLFLETVKTKGVPQTISIQAVDNMARIAGGQSPFMGLAGAFASVFKKFPYEKIGMQAHLENDMFTINGTIREGGTEYLVKRSGFSGVNIVNQNPDNRISFKDMVKRIRRITHEGEVIVE